MPTTVWLDTLKWDFIVFGGNAAGICALYLLYKVLTVPSLIPRRFRRRDSQPTK